MKNILTLSIFLFCSFLFSQYDVNVAGNAEMANSSGLWVVQKSTPNKIAGSVLLFDESVKYGVLTTIDEKQFKIPKLNINVRDTQLQSSINPDSVFVFDLKNIKSIQIENRSFKPYYNPQKYKSDFYEVIATCSEMTLLKHYDVIIKEGMVNRLTLQKQSPDTYVIKSKYYLLEDESMNDITLKKKKMYKIFSKDLNKIKNFVSEKNLSFKDENDLKMIFNYYETLISS